MIRGAPSQHEELSAVRLTQKTQLHPPFLVTVWDRHGHLIQGEEQCIVRLINPETGKVPTSGKLLL